MSQPSGSNDEEFFLIPRDPDGEYITAAEQIVRDKGNSGFIQIVRPNSPTLTPGETIIAGELQTLFPANVHLAEGNPFLTLRVSAPSSGSSTESAGQCQCLCGLTGSCGGGGGGGAGFAAQA